MQSQSIKNWLQSIKNWLLSKIVNTNQCQEKLPSLSLASLIKAICVLDASSEILSSIITPLTVWIPPWIGL